MMNKVSYVILSEAKDSEIRELKAGFFTMLRMTLSEVI